MRAYGPLPRCAPTVAGRKRAAIANQRLRMCDLTREERPVPKREYMPRPSDDSASVTAAGVLDLCSYARSILPLAAR